MGKYTSKPVEVEAHRIDLVAVEAGDVVALVLENKEVVDGSKVGVNPQNLPKGGDYLITLSETDRYVCAKDVFERKYSVAQS
jgi:hypothetical protein